ncbi:myosin heavy chain IB-like [Iris pallida]|uniref:Myosin heavy chain IB-like n=1 Tax=Iris pallida TaxID=29817 RepID=A0AAX6H3S2_IRIPA|nr:myosin heavy chain IB-like [Iris pallida]
MVWMDFGFPDFSGTILWVGNCVCGVGISWWLFSVDYLGWKLFAGIFGAFSQFWVYPGIEEVLPKFLRKLYFYLISNRLSKMFSKTNFWATTVPVCGPR